MQEPSDRCLTHPVSRCILYSNNIQRQRLESNGSQPDGLQVLKEIRAIDAPTAPWSALFSNSNSSLVRTWHKGSIASLSRFVSYAGLTMEQTHGILLEEIAGA